MGRAAELADRLRRVDEECTIAATRYGTTYASVALHLARLYFRRGIRPREALTTGLADPQISRDILARCTTKLELEQLQLRVNPSNVARLTGDKSVFYPLCAGLGIPTPTTYAVLGRTAAHVVDATAPAGRTEWEAFLRDGLPADFVVKPATGAWGEGVMVFHRDAGAFVDTREGRLSAGALFDRIMRDPKYDRFVIQQRLVSHPELVRLTGSSFLQTARLTTDLQPGGHADVHYGFFKLIVGDNAIDNFHYGRSGNLLANIALDSGVLGPAMKFAADRVGIVPVPIHPDTGAAIAGFRLPMWDDAKALAIRCARLFHPLRSIGWDIALTPRGPIVVEGNHAWDPLNVLMVGPQAPGVERHGLALLVDRLRAASEPPIRRGAPPSR